MGYPAWIRTQTFKLKKKKKSHWLIDRLSDLGTLFTFTFSVPQFPHGAFDLPLSCHVPPASYPRSPRHLPRTQTHCVPWPQLKTLAKEQVRVWGRGRKDGRRDGCVLGTRERGLLVGDGHSGLVLRVNGMDK